MANTILPVQPEDPRRATTPGLVTGDYVPLTFDEFRLGFGKFMAYMTGLEPLPDKFEATIADALTGQPVELEATLLNRAWLAVGREFPDESKRISFYARLQLVLSVIREPKHAKHFDPRASSIHVALVAAIAQAPFSSRMPPKDVKAAFDREFRRQYVAAEAADRAGKTVRH